MEEPKCQILQDWGETRVYFSKLGFNTDVSSPELEPN